MHGNALRLTPGCRAAEGVIPCAFRNAFAKDSGELYPYFRATSITLIFGDMASY
jgi:hypothetical protein